MVEILNFIFSDSIHFFGTMAMLLTIAWGISNFTLIRICISNYHMSPGSLSGSEVKNE